MKSYISKYFFLFSILNIIVFTIIFVANTSLYEKITNEDSLLEYLSFLAFMGAGFMFFLSGNRSFKFQKSRLKAFIFLLIGTVFILVAGEEISWGQRLLNFTTPESLNQVNDQNEFNFHNIDKRFFDRLTDRLTILFVYAGAFFILRRKTRFLKIILPDIFIVYTFAITPFYNQYNSLDIDFFHLIYLPVITLFVWSLIRRNNEIIFSSISIIVVSLLIMFFHVKYNELFPGSNNSANEVREYLFSIASLFYAILIYNDERLLRTKFIKTHKTEN